MGRCACRRTSCPKYVVFWNTAESWDTSSGISSPAVAAPSPAMIHERQLDQRVVIYSSLVCNGKRDLPSRCDKREVADRRKI